MRSWGLPIDVDALDVDGERLKIRNRCDYRVVLDCISALNDMDMSDDERVWCALYIFYQDIDRIVDFEGAARSMMNIIGGEDPDDNQGQNKARLMDWEHDFPRIAPPVSRVLGYSVRSDDKYTHWYDFVGAYQEIGECLFADIVAIRSKRSKGAKLDKGELQFLRDHRSWVDLPQRLTAEEREALAEEW